MAKAVPKLMLNIYLFNWNIRKKEGEDAFEFDKIIIYGNLNADGTGSWYALFFDPYGNLIDPGDLFFGSGFFLTSLDDNVDEVKHGFRFIVGYKGTCVIPNSIK